MRAIVFCLLLAACGGSHQSSPPPGGDVALAVGASAPVVQLTRPSGQKVALADVLSKHDKTVIVFYRGFF